jgi:glycosyltransferase involved in cell wall biosynthesis
MVSTVTEIKAIITTLDNLPLLKEQVDILRSDPLISEIIIVCNGSQDGTAEWLATQPDLTSIIRENKGAGPGRNAGIDAAGKCDYFLFLDGGIRPLRGGTQRMLDYLERVPEADVIGVEIADFETDYNKAWRRWPDPILPEHTYRNTRLSHTAYCLTRYRAFDGLRFCEEGPFAQPGWGADDDEMCYQWNEAGIVVHVVTNIHPYRRASGSFRRLFLETGIWPNQYGSVYEQRVVWLQQNWPQHKPAMQWGEPEVTAVIKVGKLEPTIRLIKQAHDLLRNRRFDDDEWGHIFRPYSVIAWMPEKITKFLAWAGPRRLRQHHGTMTIINGEIVRRSKENDHLWTGDFRISTADNWRDDIRPACERAYLIEDKRDLDQIRIRTRTPAVA